MKKLKQRNCWAKSWSNVYSIALCHIEERGRGAMITKRGKQIIYDEDLLISWVPFEFFAQMCKSSHLALSTSISFPQHNWR